MINTLGETATKMFNDQLRCIFGLIEFTIITPIGDDIATKDYVCAERLEVTSNSGYCFYAGDMLIKSIKYDPDIKLSTEMRV